MRTPLAGSSRPKARFALGRLAALFALVLVGGPVVVRAGSDSTAAATARANLRLAIARAEDGRHADDPQLRRALTSTEPALRARALLACGRIQDSTLVPVVAPLLEDPDGGVRQEAAFALGQIGNRSARPALEAALAAGDPDVRRLAVEALGKLGDKAATPKVVAALSDPAPRTRAEAAVALWRLADSTALGALIAHHDDPDADVRWRVLYALEKIVAPDRIVLIAALHLDDPEWLTRAFAVRTIGRQKAIRGVAYAVGRLGDPDPRVIVNALRALQSIADSTCESCTDRIARTLAHDDPYVRVTAATVLGERFPMVAAGPALRRAVFDSLEHHLSDPDAATRGACARALLIQRGDSALAEVKPMLADTALYARVAAIGALAHVDSTSALPLLLPRLAPGRPLFVRMTALETLGQLRVHSVIPEVRAALADTALLYAASAASVLGELGDKASIPALTATFVHRAHDAEPDARIAIRDALRELAGAAYADSLEKAHPAASSARVWSDEELANPPDARGAILHTTKGDIEWEFYRGDAPLTVRNFAGLARRHYFDGSAFHRVVPNFVIQDGDPTGTGSGGPGWTIRCEYNRLPYDAGMVGMALSGKDTGGSQWFITHSPQMHLNGRYTIFARVTRGMDVVDRIVQGDRVLRVEILN